MTALLLLLACGDKDMLCDWCHTGDSHADDSADTGDTGTEINTYSFDSAFDDGSSVSYSGQVLRQLLVDDMKSHIGGMTDRLNNGWVPVEGEAAGEIYFYLEFDSSTGGTVEHGKADITDDKAYNDISSGKDLFGKLAGNDSKGQHKDWSTDFVGWTADGVTTPESLVRTWISQLDAQAVAWGSGNVPLDPQGSPVPHVGVTPEGVDLIQMLDKFTRGAVAFSQASDDYMDDDTEDHGLNSDHTAAKEDANYTALEHGWDEGFGYFGAAQDYTARSDIEISDSAAFDTNGDGSIDLTSEYSWGHSINAAKRDKGAVAPTDFTLQAWNGFFNGRALLTSTAGTALTDTQMEELKGYRDEAIAAWEKAISSTVVHYINDTLQDMGTLGTDDYSFADHAKHWSEMKGFALVLQFNPKSPLEDADFVALHKLLGQAPGMDADYAADLLGARALLGDAYAFDTANLGADDGTGGW